MSDRAGVEQEFRRRFGPGPAVLVRAPGRVNLIGEHTDYNDGFVLPIAIDRQISIALRRRPDGRVVVHSLDYGESVEFSLDQVTHATRRWAEYVKGVAWVLRDVGCALVGWEGVVGGDVPRGAGLSSSAAVELATLRACVAASDLPWRPAEMARLGQRVENEWIGVRSGIMDQTIIALGRKDHALLIDCRTLDVEPAAIPAGVSVVVLDTSTRRRLAESAYNERRSQCEAAARGLGVPALRDVAAGTFAARSPVLDPMARRRARHVIGENERTLEAAAALRADDVEGVGRLMNASHASLRDDFEVTNPALDAIVAVAQRQPGCFGARMTGAGFGGCAVALVAADQAVAFVAGVEREYRAATDLTPSCYVCRATDGVSAEVLAA